MRSSAAALVLVCVCIASLAQAFHVSQSRVARQARSWRMAVTEVRSEAQLDAAVSAAGTALVVVDYSTTWCGPCKMIAPKYDEMSEKYSNVVFLKCIGDISPEASVLMKREGVRAVPSFHLWKSGAKVDAINGANLEALEAAVNNLK